MDDTPGDLAIPEEALPRPLRGKRVHLITRELDAETAGSIMEASTDKDGKMNQTRFMALILVHTVRNADDPEQALVWNTSFIQPLLQRNAAPMIAIAMQAVKQSGLNVQLDAEKKDSGATTVEGSLSDSLATSIA